MSEAEPLGLLGGTFDPPHVGHLRLAIEAREALGLARVRLIPAGRPPLRGTPGATAAERLAMAQRAIAATPGCELDRGEIDAAAHDGAPSYTVTTLERLRGELGDRRPLVLLLGADAFARLEAWRRWRDIFGLAHVGVATRPGHELKVGAGGTALDGEFRARRGIAADLVAPAGRIVPFSITALEVSATAIRERLAGGRDIDHLVPPAVLDYIHSHQLYRTPHGH